MKEESGAKAGDLTDIRSQIDAIRIVHDKLHALGEVEEIRFGEYLEELLGTLFSNFSSRSVRVEVATDGAVLTTRTVIPLGLLVNETATNAIKHGFSDEQEARFEVRLSQTEDGRQWQLRISNSGRPFPRDVSLERPESLGLRLITSLAAQLEGRVELTRRPYPVFTITFPVDQES
jgi:two-component sensor histidine kinase